QAVSSVCVAIGLRPVYLVSDRGRRGHLRGDVGAVAVMPWLRRRLLTGFFVSIPLVISVFALVWIFGIIDGLTAPLAARVLGHGEPTGYERLLVSTVGLLGTVAVVLA